MAMQPGPEESHVSSGLHDDFTELLHLIYKATNNGDHVHLRKLIDQWPSIPQTNLSEDDTTTLEVARDHCLQYATETGDVNYVKSLLERWRPSVWGTSPTTSSLNSVLTA